MREQLIQYVRLLFAGTPDSEDMQQEILQNTLDRYDDLIDQGKAPEAAYRLAIAGIGEISELLATAPLTPASRDPEAQKGSWKFLIFIGILLINISILLFLFIGGFRDSQEPTVPPTSAPPGSSSSSSPPLQDGYRVTCADSFTQNSLLEPLQECYRPGETVTLKTGIVYDADLQLYVNGDFICTQTTIKTGDEYTHWEFYFTMPDGDAVIKLKAYGGTEPPVPPELKPEDRYMEAVILAEEGKKAEAAIAFARLGDFLDARERCFALWAELRQNVTISGHHILAGIRSDGTVITMGSSAQTMENVKNWTNMRYLSGSVTHILGITADGTVLADGDNTYGQCNVSHWQDIVAVCAGEYFSVGLTSDGTVVYAGILGNPLYKAEEWTDIVMLETSGKHIVGLRCDGTVVATGLNDYGQCEVEGIQNVIDIYTDNLRTALLCTDGTLINVGSDTYALSETYFPGLVTYNVVADCHYGTMADGSVVCLQYDNTEYPFDLNTWQNCVLFFHRYGRLYGLQPDGSVIQLYASAESEAQDPDWTDMMVP